MQWKDAASIGGLALGLFNLWMLVFRKRPYLYLEPFPPILAAGTEPGQLRLRIFNPSELPLQISGLTIWGRNANFMLLALAPRQFIHMEEEAAARWLVFDHKGIFRDFIDGGEIRYYAISDLEEISWAIVIFWWHRNGFLQLRLPMCLYLSKKKINTILNKLPDIPI